MVLSTRQLISVELYNIIYHALYNINYATVSEQQCNFCPVISQNRGVKEKADTQITLQFGIKEF